MCDREKEEKYRLYGGQDKPSEVDCGQGSRDCNCLTLSHYVVSPASVGKYLFPIEWGILYLLFYIARWSTLLLQILLK